MEQKPVSFTNLMHNSFIL